VGLIQFELPPVRGPLDEGLNSARSGRALDGRRRVHVLDVWETQKDFDTFMPQLGPILGASRMELAGPPEIGDLVNVVTSDGGRSAGP